MALSLLHKSPKVPFYLKKKKKKKSCWLCLLLPRGWQRAGPGRGKKRMSWRGLGLSRFCFPVPLAWTRTRAHQLCWVVRRWLLLVDLESTVMVGNTGHVFPGSVSWEHRACRMHTLHSVQPTTSTEQNSGLYEDLAGAPGARGRRRRRRGWYSPMLSGSHWRMVISSTFLSPFPPRLHTAPAQHLLQPPSHQWRPWPLPLLHL